MVKTTVNVFDLLCILTELYKQRYLGTGDTANSLTAYRRPES